MKRLLHWFIPFVLVLFAVSTAMAVTIPTVSKEVGKEGGAFSVNTGGSGSWTATTSADWITLNRASGEAGVSCIYIVAANFSADTRTGTINIGGNTFTVYQTGYEATIAPTSATADYEGGNGTIEVTVDAGVSWSAKPNVSWLSVSPASGMSIGSVTYTVAAYTTGTTPRTGTITIAGKTFSVTQTGTDVIITPTTTKLGSGVETFNVTVAALAETAWSVTPNASWISVVDSGHGYGNDTLLVAVGANPSVLPRTGTVSIGSKTLTVTQAGTTNISLSITPTEAIASPVGAYGNVAVYSTPDAPWKAETQDSWITISEGASGAGNGNTKYVVTANPTLEERSGTIVFKQVPTEPDNQLEAGRLMYIETFTDIATGKRSTSRALDETFDGTFSITLTGEPLPKLEKNDWSFAIKFKISELGAVHRLMTLFGSHAVYIDENNVLWFDGHKTDYEVATRKQWHWLVFCQDEGGHAWIYAGRDGAVSLVAEYDSNPMRDFTHGTTALSDSFVFGYTESPSKGYLKNGAFQNLQLWGRMLAESEVQRIGALGDGFESIPQSISDELSCRHFTCNQNGYYAISPAISWNSLKDIDATVSGWSEFPGRHGVRQRAMRSSGGGRFLFANINDIFTGSYVVNNGVEFNRKTGHYAYEAPAGGYVSVPCPFPITWTGESNTTWNFWIYIDSLPKTNSLIFSRKRESGQWTEASGQLVNPLCKNNESFGLKLNSLGQVVVIQNGEESSLTGEKITPKTWKMLTVVGITDKSITVYLDGKEIGNIPTILSFGFFPPTDTRYCANNVIYNDIIDTVQSLSIGGWDGAIDEMTFIDGALTSSQVKKLYDATKPVEIYHTVRQGVIDPVVAPSEATFEAVGGDGRVQVTVAANTQWTISSGAKWISLLGNTSRIGSAEVSYAVAANPSTEVRTGTFTLAGKTVTVTQAGLWSQLTYDGTVFDETSGSGFISVQVEGDGTWTASSDASWLTLLDTSGHGSAEVMFVVDDFNTTVASRTATVTIAGKTVEITQRGYTLSIEPAVADLSSNAGAGEIGITAPIDAVWEAIVTADWITLVGGNMGVGNGTLRYTVADNTTGELRTGKIIISGQEYTITQHANLTLTALVEGSGTVAGAGDYETNERVTLTAAPAEGFAFTHWSGDAVGVEPQVTIVMDMPKTVTAHFIPEDAAARLAEEKAAQGGFYTREQMKALAMGDTVIEVDPDDGRIDLAIQLQESADLSGGEWNGVDVGGDALGVDGDGVVHIKMAPKGNTAFYRLVKAPEE